MPDSPAFAEALILGAGPGGATAALCLARAGMRPVLLDKAAFPRDKVCGDALSGKVVDTLRKIDPALAEDLGGRAEHLPCWGVEFIAPSGDVLEVPFRLDYAERMGRERAPGYIARRVDFDDWLLRHALATRGPGGEAAEFHDGTTVRDLAPVRLADGRPGVAVTARDGRVWHTPWLLAADGAQSVAARQLAGHAMDPRHHSAAVRAYYRGVTDLHPHHFIELHYLRGVLPGYLWIFPLPDGRANVGLGLRSDQIAARRLDLKKLLDETIAAHPQLRRRFADAEPEGPVRGFGLPLGSRRLPLVGNGWMLLGDAASLIDPFTGEGIGNAMISGRLAAERVLALRTEGRNTAADLRPYADAVWRQLGDELRLSHTLQRLATRPRLFNFVVRKAARNAALRETISCMFEDLDLRERLRRPGFYVRLLFSPEGPAPGNAERQAVHQP